MLTTAITSGNRDGIGPALPLVALLALVCGPTSALATEPQPEVAIPSDTDGEADDTPPSSAEAVLDLEAELAADDGEPPEPAASLGVDGEELRTEDILVSTGTRSARRLADDAAGTIVLGEDVVQQRQAVDLGELLTGEPSLAISRSFRGSSLTLHGLGARHVLLLVDGRRVNGRLDGAIDLSRLVLDGVAQVEVVPGAVSSLYGSDAMAGVINVIRRRPTSPFEGRARLAYGERDRIDTALTLGSKWCFGESLLWASYRSEAAFDRDPSTVATDGSGVERLVVGDRTRFDLGGGVSLIAFGDFEHRDVRGVDASLAGAVYDRRNLRETATAGVELLWDGRSDGDGSLRAAATFSMFRDQFALDQRGSDALDQYERTNDQLVEVVVQYDRLVADEHRLSVGIEGLYERLESGRIDAGLADRFRGAAYIQDDWILESELADGTPLTAWLVPSVRLDIDSQFGVQPTPRLAARVDFGPIWTLRASVGMGYRAPDVKELYLRFANPSAGYEVVGSTGLGTETSVSSRLAVAVALTDTLELSLGGFHHELWGLIEPLAPDDPKPGELLTYVYENVGRARTAGLEAQVSWRAFEWLRLGASYTFTHAWNLDEDRQLAGRAAHRAQATLGLDSALTGTSADLRVSYVGPMRVETDLDGATFENDTLTDPYVWIEATARQRLAGQWSLFLRVSNLLDAGGNSRLLALAPRQIQAGVAFDWSL